MSAEPNVVAPQTQTHTPRRAWAAVILLAFIRTVDYVDRFLHRATASAIFLFFSAVIGAAGPFLTGLISDSLTAELGNLALGRGLTDRPGRPGGGHRLLSARQPTILGPTSRRVRSIPASMAQ